MQHVQKRWYLVVYFGGLGKCMKVGVAGKLCECILVGQDTENSRFKLTYDRLWVLMVDAHHIFAADILHHKKCYSSYLTQVRKSNIGKKKPRSRKTERNVKCM